MSAAVSDLSNLLVDRQTVGVFLNSSLSVLASHACRVYDMWEKKTTVSFSYNEPVFLAYLPSLTLSFQPHSRPFVWLLVCIWIRKNMDCFAV